MFPWMSAADDDGDDVRFIPAPPVVTESFAFGVPANTDAPDAAVNLATLFAVTAAGSILGIDWRTPDTAPGVVPVVQLWNSDTVTLLGSAVVAPVIPGTVQRTLFGAPVAVVPGVNYHAQVWTDRYALTPAYPGWPVTTTNMHTATIDPGAFTYAGAPAYAANTVTSCYFVGPVATF